ncbi:MAG: hypothetical protein WCT44_00680 [Candidatus Paceibacterota bacterium]
MIEIKDLLSRFDKILISEEGKRETVRQVISEIIKIEIKKEEIKTKNGVIYLNIKPIYKNEVFMKQEEIFLKLKEVFGNKVPQNIR